MKRTSIVDEDGILVWARLKELYILHAALNEICNGIDIFEFETRIGASLDEMNRIMVDLGEIIDATE
ncbi:hypothetical protein [Ensifer adhaerens]|uniref:hypothetical protein n=1 Tax=Ensifer adhaerens TaxID=106592 RepID=UPI00098FD2C1|nr:hypothetical protein [Ensifer adhaerens]